MTMDLRTLCDIFYQSVETYRKPDALRYKKDGAWRDISSEEFRRAVEELSMGLRALGIDRGDRVAILSENRPEWAYADLAILCAAAVDVPIYTSLTAAPGPLSPERQPVQGDLRLQRAAGGQGGGDPRPGPGDEARHPHGRRGGDGHAHPGRGARPGTHRRWPRDRGAVKTRAAESKPGDLATIIYTSGTTGEPKGVMLTHDNIVSNVAACPTIVSDFGPTTSPCPSFPCATSSSAWAAST